jgi:hypothetical protein
MIAEKTKAAVTYAVESELKNCTAVYDYQFHSLHEAESVLLEELQEVSTEQRKVWDGWNHLHKCVRENDVEQAVILAKAMEQAAERVMMESAQVAACAKKLQRGTVI